MDLLTLALPPTLFLATYAAVSGLAWLRVLVGERAARRTGMALNLARRAGPPAAGGLIVLLAGGSAGANGAGVLAALLISGGLAYGLHRGLSDVGRPGWRTLAPRLAVALAVTLAALWLVAPA